MNCSLPGSSVHGISQARILEWIAISFSRGSSWPRDQTCISYIAGRFFTTLITWETHVRVCCCRSVAQSCPTICDPINCSTPGFPVLYHFPEVAQTHVHWISDAIQPSHPLSPAFSFCPQSFPASVSFPVSWLFASGDQSIGTSASASILPMNIQDWFLLGLTDLITLVFKGLSRVFCSLTIWKHQFFGAWPSLWSNSHPYTTKGKP